MIPVLFRIGSVPITTWPLLAFAGLVAAFHSLRRETRDLGLSAAELRVLYVVGTAAGFAGSHWMFGWNVGAGWDPPPAQRL